jgi:outer membrane protein TolC
LYVNCFSPAEIPLRLLIPISIFLLVFAGQLAQSQTLSNPDSALQAILDQIAGERITLEQATRYAMENATSIRTAEANYLAASGSARRERGGFDPYLYFSLNYADAERPTASFFAGAPILNTQETTSETGLLMDLPTGTQLQLALSTVSLKSNSGFAFLNPQHDAFGSLSLRQPLMGGFMASGRKDLTKAERDLDAAKARYDQEVIALTAETERGYWDLYAAERDYAVQRLTRDRAEAFLHETELRAHAGLVGPNQVANARTFLAEQELLLLDREEHHDRQSDLFAALIGVRPTAGLPRFIATDEPPADFPIEPVDDLVREALETNLDLKAAWQDVEAVRALADAAGWEALPQVDLVGSLGGSGLSGTPRDVIFGGDTLRTVVSGSFGDAVQQAASRDYPSWSVGIDVNIPIGLRAGLGEQERLEAEVMAAEQRALAAERVLEEQVRSVHRALVNGNRRLQAARSGVDAGQEQVRIGLIEFYNGRATAFELVRLGEDFALAQRRYSEALVRTAKAAATMRQLTSGGYERKSGE